MSLSMAPLLMESEQVPAEARDAIRAAYGASSASDRENTEAVAIVLDLQGIAEERVSDSGVEPLQKRIPAYRQARTIRRTIRWT